jgi:hypothetical protein
LAAVAGGDRGGGPLDIAQGLQAGLIATPMPTSTMSTRRRSPVRRRPVVDGAVHVSQALADDEVRPSGSCVTSIRQRVMVPRDRAL